MSYYFLLGYASEIRVWQVPPDLEVTQGGNATITCNYYVPADYPRVTITWKKENEVIDFKCMNVQLRNGSNASSVLQLISLHQNQSGLYKCEVRIETPVLWTGCGNGTNVSITGKETYFFLRQVFGPCMIAIK